MNCLVDMGIFVWSIHSKPTLFTAFLLFLSKNAIALLFLAHFLNDRHTQKSIPVHHDVFTSNHLNA